MPITWEKSDVHIRGASEHATYYVMRDFSTQRWYVECVYTSGLRKAVPDDFASAALAQAWCTKIDHDHDGLRARIDGQFAAGQRIAADAIATSRRQEADEEQRFWDSIFVNAFMPAPGSSSPADIVLAEDCANLAVQRRRARIEDERKKLEEERTKP